MQLLQCFFFLIVKIIDFIFLGIPMLSGTTTLMVNILNTNDKAPFFVPATQNAAVSSLLK